jgi:hypothetical protein
MPDVAPWDIWVVNATTLAKVAYVSNWNDCTFGDQVNDPGHGAVNLDYDEPWLTTFYNDNSEFPWEGNYAVQIYRSGSLVFTFLIEEAEIEYAGPRRRAVMGGRGLAACLEWAIVIPEKYDDGLVVSGNLDPDALVEVMGRGFGATHNVQADLETQAGDTMPRHGTMGDPESYHGPKYKAYGGGAFVHLFNEANTGLPATTALWLDTDSTPGGTRGVEAWTTVTLATLVGGGGAGDRNGDAVDWPLSLSSNLSERYDSNGTSTANEWSYTSTYTADDVQWLFDLQTGQNYFQVLNECVAKTANSQWRVAPNGEISIAKLLGSDLSATVMLTVPQAVRSANSLRRTDLRTSMFISNDFVFERANDTTAEATYGRREGFVKYDNTHGQSNIDAANQALNEVKDVLDEFTFQYVETDTTEAWTDFGISDTVKIEYEPGVFSSRQVVGLSANVSPEEFAVEITIGEVVDNVIARLRKVEETEQYSPQITQANAYSSGKPMAPLNIVAVAGQEGGDRFATVTFDQPKGWENEMLLYEAVVNPVDAPTKTYRRTTSVNRRSTQQEVVIHGLPSGPEGKEYEVSARSVTKTQLISDYHVGDDFTVAASSLDDVTGESDAPDEVSGISLFPMLNAILVKFSDLNGGNDHAMVGNRGRYEIQISNNESGGTNGSFSETSGNEWTQTFGLQESGWDEDDAQTFVVPSGDGFICAGLKSESPARRHFVRVRAVNWDNTPQDDWSVGSGEYSEWVDLDLDDQSQLGVIIGKEGIYATHIKAGTIDTTRIDTGTLTASNADIGQIFTSAIRMPQPATAEDAGELNDGTTGNEMTFNIDHDGNIWWGNYADIDDAKAGTNADTANGTDAATSWIDNTGDVQFIGRISTGAGSATDIFANGNAGEPRMVIGDNTTDLGFGGSSGGYGYLLGFTANSLEAIPGHTVFTEERWIDGDTSSAWTGAAYLVAPRFHSGFKYAGVRLRDPSGASGDGEAILVHPKDMDYMGLIMGARPEATGTAYAEVTGVVTAPGGFKITSHAIATGTPGGLTLDSGTPATGDDDTGAARVKLWNDGGDLMWGDTNVGGGSGDITAVTTAATSGLAGGVLTGAADLSLDFNGLDTGTSVVAGGLASDYVAFYDSSTSSHKKVRFANIAHSWFKADGLADMGSSNTATSDLLMVYDDSASLAKKVDLAEIIALSPQGTVTAVDVVADRGLYLSGASSPTPSIGLSLLTALDEITPVVGDWVAIHDNSLGYAKRVTIQDINDLGPQGDIETVTAGFTSGMSVTSGTGPIPDISLNLGKLGEVLTPTLGDKVGIYDTSLATTGYCTIQDINDLGPQGTGDGDLTAVTVSITSGLSVTSGTGPIPDISLNLGKLTYATPVVGDKVGIYDNSAAVTRYCTIQNILDLAAAGDGDVTGILTGATSGLYTVSSGGPIPDIRLDLSRLTAGSLHWGDYIAMHDVSASGTYRTTAQDIADIAITTHLTNGGIWQTGANGTIGISFSNMLAYPTPTTTDLLMFYDSSTAGVSYQTIWSILALAPQTTAFTNGGLYTSTTSSASGTMKISFGNMTLSTASAADLLCFQIGSSNVVGYNSVANVLNLVGGATTPVTHDFYLSGSRIIQATGNLYMRSGSGANYGAVAWSNGVTSLYYATGTQLQTGTSGVSIHGVNLWPSTHNTQNLGLSGNWWKYSYHYKMDASVLPSWSGTGWYMWINDADQVMRATSSERVKTGVTTISPTDALARIKGLRPVEFTPTNNPSDLVIDDLWQYERFKGFIAEEVAVVDHDYGVWNWWKSDDPESEGYDKTLPSLCSIQDEWTEEEVTAYYDLDKANPVMFDVHAILADSVAAIQALEARIAVLES